MERGRGGRDLPSTKKRHLSSERELGLGKVVFDCCPIVRELGLISLARLRLKIKEKESSIGLCIFFTKKEKGGTNHSCWTGTGATNDVGGARKCEQNGVMFGRESEAGRSRRKGAKCRLDLPKVVREKEVLSNLS